MRYFNGMLIKIYNRIISGKFINKNNKFCRKIRSILFHNICYECRARFGKRNREKIFYLIRCPQEEMGLFAVINFVIYHFGKADELGAQPVVDWQYYPNKYFMEDDKVGKENVWEYYFKQSVKLEEVYHSKNVIMSSGGWELPCNEVFDTDSCMRSHKLVEKYMQLNDETNAIYLREYKRLEMNKKRVLGVKCRGTDFRVTRPEGHAIVPETEMTIQVINEKMEEWGGFDKIYLATEDEEIQRKLKEYYGNKLEYTDGRRIELNTNQWLSEVYDAIDSKNQKKEDMLNYLISIYLLAACDSLIAPQVGGTIGAMRIKGRYKHTYIFQLGLYGKEEKTDKN